MDDDCGPRCEVRAKKCGTGSRSVLGHWYLLEITTQSKRILITMRKLGLCKPARAC
ncbi:hypothetical protein PILCRDRAFT_824406 [Piloderma croceum F 1598]|uniref:Uncharacterized protein n=1 Tax=Piloderma croceum (strain F 1598) TaxID=765440 RepID=A0A0C3F135_PILCF|nr:hypothetical protein PILCRDRAFT_824406 [Piloderma croceum F 1598]